MEKENTQTWGESGSTVTRNTPASTAVGMVSVISVAMLTAMEVVVQSDQYDAHPARYAGVVRSSIDEILRCKKMWNEIETLQIQLDET